MTVFSGGDGSAPIPSGGSPGGFTKYWGLGSKATFVGLLHKLWNEFAAPDPERLMDSVLYSVAGAAAGTRFGLVRAVGLAGPVRSSLRGNVVLAGAGWNARGPFSAQRRELCDCLGPEHDASTATAA